MIVNQHGIRQQPRASQVDARHLAHEPATVVAAEEIDQITDLQAVVEGAQSSGRDGGG